MLTCHICGCNLLDAAHGKTTCACCAGGDDLSADPRDREIADLAAERDAALAALTKAQPVIEAAREMDTAYARTMEPARVDDPSVVARLAHDGAVDVFTRRTNEVLKAIRAHDAAPAAHAECNCGGGYYSSNGHCPPSIVEGGRAACPRWKP